ncbi:cyclic nucleotide-binding domain-containing protein [Magnetospirillum fulvum]|uniref:cAMP-binding protein-catabolite gene activator and regulatory subunit of cAMP-dependent protein kinase n=1 Tax=Magnetospirillum fulvum MGU-K5 TaxID=1316936 RepID=S9SAX0_MAGFU|nr:cyclic nucleotide-binding domain-containing protein [Magnetospirillum fulvum]EPY01203.1 cAMP-binding protein - catabolite gene activator and regulatory subunit of cAMP-dependent protein kinase [Magnetospirillum fulvum MGU-K5]
MIPPLRTELLRRVQLVPLFAELDRTDLAGLLDGAASLRLPHRHTLFRPGQAADTLYVVLDGHVELSRQTGGRRSVVEVAGPDALLGDEAVFGDGQHGTGARVLAGATVLAIPAAPFRARLADRPDLMRQLLATMSLRLRGMLRQIADLKLKTTAQRLGGFLLTLTADDDGPARLRLPYDKRLVAEQLGMQPESLSRALTRLGAVGVTAAEDGCLEVGDLVRLRAFCAEEDEA